MYNCFFSQNLILHKYRLFSQFDRSHALLIACQIPFKIGSYGKVGFFIIAKVITIDIDAQAATSSGIVMHEVWYRWLFIIGYHLSFNSKALLRSAIQLNFYMMNIMLLNRPGIVGDSTF